MSVASRDRGAGGEPWPMAAAQRHEREVPLRGFSLVRVVCFVAENSDTRGEKRKSDRTLRGDLVDWAGVFMGHARAVTHTGGVGAECASRL